MKRAIGILFFVLILLILYTMGAPAQEHRHPSGVISGAAAQFYARWDRPDMPGMSCCSLKDCYATAARQVNGAWFFLRREDHRWVGVPAVKIETRYDSPDGLAHVCASPPENNAVYCFLPAGGA